MTKVPGIPIPNILTNQLFFNDADSVKFKRILPVGFQFEKFDSENLAVQIREISTQIVTSLPMERVFSITFTPGKNYFLPQMGEGGLAIIFNAVVGENIRGREYLVAVFVKANDSKKTNFQLN